MKGPLFDIENHEQRGYWTGGENSFMAGGSSAPQTPGPSSYPSCGEVPSDSFQPTMSCQSPTGSNMSGHTHHTHAGSTHSNSSTGPPDQINFDNKGDSKYIYYALSKKNENVFFINYIIII